MYQFEIYFKDLNPETQKRFLNFHEIETASAGGFDIIPIFTVEKERRETDVIEVMEMKSAMYCNNCDSELLEVKVGENCPSCGYIITKIIKCIEEEAENG